MISGAMLIAVAYLLLSLGILLVERRRTREGGPDAVSVFITIFWLQCCVAGGAICAMLPFVDGTRPTGVQFIDNVFRAADFTSLMMVFALTAAFVVFFYVGCAIAQLAFGGVRAAPRAGRFEMIIHENRLWAVLVAGAVLTGASFWLLGDTMFLRYANLILLRSDDPHVTRNVLNSNAFVLTQAWGWLAVIPLFTIAKRRGFGPTWWLCLALAIAFALMGVSRRALFLPVLMSYLALALATQRWRIGYVVAAAGPMILWIAFGKDLISAIAYGGTVERALGVYESLPSALLRSSSDIGITVVESIGTISLIDVPPRWGMDHLLSLAQRFPEGLLGLDIDWPERMVRISTRVFVGENHQDVPPGLMGQMWLDFRVFGPVVWGLLFGLQVGLVQQFWTRTVKTVQSAVVFVIITFVIALPINSGSFDFSFGMDIIVLVLALYLCCSWRPLSDQFAGAAGSGVLVRSQ